MAKQYLRFNDLKAREIVRNRTTLARWIKKYGFPPGVLLGPNTRACPDCPVRALVHRENWSVPPRGPHLPRFRPSGVRCPLVARAVAKFRPGVKGH